MKTITSIEELEALPEGAIVQDLDGGTYCKTGVVWTDIGYIHPIEFLAQDLIRPGAVTLLHPLTFDSEDIERAMEATFEAIKLAPSRSREAVARAVLGSVGSVEA